jgi:hypothetical protein
MLPKVILEMHNMRPIFLAMHSGKRNSPVMEAFLQIVESALPKLATTAG